MAERTPPPWKVSSGSTHILPVGAAGGICKFESLHGMYTNHEANAAFIVKAVNSHDALKASLAEMVGVYWGDGDGHEPPPQCIQRAKTVLASIEENE